MSSSLERVWTGMWRLHDRGWNRENREDNALVSTEDGTEGNDQERKYAEVAFPYISQTLFVDVPLEGGPTAISMYALPFVLLIKSLNTPARVGTASLQPLVQLTGFACQLRYVAPVRSMLGLTSPTMMSR